MTALRQVLDQREPSVPVVELIDISDIGAPLGIKCRVVMAPSMAGRVDTTAMLLQLRDALIMTASDRALALLRAVVLAGERPKPPAEAVFDHRWLERLRAGIAGVSESGRMLALSVAGRGASELVVFALWLITVKYIDRPPVVMVSFANDFLGADLLDYSARLRARTVRQ